MQQVTGSPRVQGDAEAELKAAEAAADAEVAASAAGGGFAKPDVRELLGAQLALLPYTACKARRRAAVAVGEGPCWLARHDLATHALTPVCRERRWPQGIAMPNGVCVLCATPACQSSVSCDLARRVRCFGKGERACECTVTWASTRGGRRGSQRS